MSSLEELNTRLQRVVERSTKTEQRFRDVQRDSRATEQEESMIGTTPEYQAMMIQERTISALDRIATALEKQNEPVQKFAQEIHRLAYWVLINSYAVSSPEIPIDNLRSVLSTIVKLCEEQGAKE